MLVVDMAGSPQQLSKLATATQVCSCTHPHWLLCLLCIPWKNRVHAGRIIRQGSKEEVRAVLQGLERDVAGFTQ